MKMGENSAPSKPVVLFTFTFTTDYKPFNFSCLPETTTTPASPWAIDEATYCRKRARPLADDDGHRNVITKKRRLRLAFVTSRLSAPFTSPPSNNVDRGNCKVAVWARQRSMMGPSGLRKAAILNRIKREAMAAREAQMAQQRQIELARQLYYEQFIQNSPPRRSSKRLQARKASKSTPAPTSESPKPKQKPAKGGYQKKLEVVPVQRRPPTPPDESELEKQRSRRTKRR